MVKCPGATKSPGTTLRPRLEGPSELKELPGEEHPEEAVGCGQRLLPPEDLIPW